MKVGPFRDRLFIEGELQHVRSVAEQSAVCTTKKGGEELKFTDGTIGIELEEVTLKEGNLSFVPAV
jgi:hypothetical protein